MAIFREVRVMIALRRCSGLVLMAVMLSACGNFLGRMGEQMTDQPEKERAQTRAVK